MMLKNSSLLVRPLLYLSSAIALEMLWYCSNADDNVAIMLGCCHGISCVVVASQLSLCHCSSCDVGVLFPMVVTIPQIQFAEVFLLPLYH